MQCTIAPTTTTTAPSNTQVPVWAVLDYTNTRCISRELLLVKVSILGPDYLEAQLLGGPSHDPRSSPAHGHGQQPDPDAALEDRSLTFEQEVALAEQFQSSGTGAGAGSGASQSQQSQQNNGTPASSPSPAGMNPTSGTPPPLTPAEALRLKHQHLHSVSVLASQFGARIVDVSENGVIVEMSGKTNRVEAFLSLLKPFGIIESARTGAFSSFHSSVKRFCDSDDDDDCVCRNDGDASHAYCVSANR